MADLDAHPDFGHGAGSPSAAFANPRHLAMVAREDRTPGHYGPEAVGREVDVAMPSVMMPPSDL
eukprot:12001610-Alexandrium_andersonii.AAC.1